MSFKLPIFDKRFFCIVNHNSSTLAALIASYTYSEHFYTPFFECNTATISKPDEIIEGFHEDYITVTSLQELDVKLSNALNMIGGCEYLILGGLDDKQKSYLSFLDNYNVIDVQTKEDVHFFLDSIVSKEGALKCNEQNILQSLYQASKQNKYLEIDNSVDDIIIPSLIHDGLIVIEDIKTVSTIISINYSLSINAGIAIIPRPKINVRQIHSFIKDWKNGNSAAYDSLLAEVYDSIHNIDFTKFKFATFFTIGIPYSLILKNIIPISHVNLNISSGIFIFDGIYYETNLILASSIVFSPLEFIDEETEFVKTELTKYHYNVKELIGSSATAHNLDFNIKEFPFNLLHICSHGGEINGSEIIETFNDSEGNTHTVKYDEVVSFAPSPGKELIPVTIKRIFREFDGFDWNNNEEKDKYPHYIFTDMFKAISGLKKHNRKSISEITDSCSIKCSDFNYQAMFNMLAGVFSPIIYNNTCWSWYEVAQSFLSSGARGYIGTLWSIRNSTAKACAEKFYKSIFCDTVLNSLHQSLVCAKGTNDENIYLFWGLHFTSLPKGNSISESRLQIAEELLISLERWRNKLNQVETPNKKNIQEIIEWDASQLAGDFYKETTSLIKIK